MRGRVTWDEANLDEIEANKPVRQKITEPKTPYHRMIDDDSHWDSFEDGAVTYSDAGAICSTLTDADSSSRNRALCSGWTSSEDEKDMMDQDDEDSESKNSERFREQRRVHYDEFRKVKELLQTGPFLEDASDEDQDGCLEKDGRSDSSSSAAVVKESGFEVGSQDAAQHASVLENGSSKTV